jgi:uncharacterized protein YcbX
VAAGTVLSLHRWPVKSMAGEDHAELRLDRRGIDGDRLRALLDVHKGAPRQVTVRQIPRLLLWSARHDGTITCPRGRSFAWGTPELAAALEEDLGRPLEMVADERLMQDLGDSVLVTTRATHAAVEEALGTRLDLRRWRTNIHADLDAPAYAEEGWQGRTLRVGEATFEVLHPCERCVIPTRDPETAAKLPELLRWLTRHRGGLFGINARATGPATIRVGDPVEVL